MDADVIVETDRLRVRHRVVNDASEPMYLLNRLPDWYGLAPDDAAGITTSLAFVNVDADHSAVLYQGDVPPPRGVEAYEPPEDTDADADVVEVWHVTLRIAYHLESDLVVPPREHVNFPGSWMVVGRATWTLEAHLALPAPRIAYRRRSRDVRFT
jgi:hypothetical protein